MKSAIPFLIKKAHEALDKIDEWCEEKEDREEKKDEERTSKKDF